MDDSFRNWSYYEQPLKGNLGLQLMPSVVERDTKPLLPNGSFMQHPDSSVSMEFIRDHWMHHNREAKMHHVLPMNHNYHVLPDPPATNTLQMLQPTDTLKEDKLPTVEEPVNRNDAPLKKRSQGRASKAPKVKKPKKANDLRDVEINGSASRGRTAKNTNTSMIINGVNLDISGIPTPVCSCTGTPQQCYRWGVGGWQSACCTTSISMYPLPMSTKRRGARIAGRKMSQGAFKKVLERLASEGQDLSNPIDLRTFWAKHGTNKFVTIR